MPTPPVAGGSRLFVCCWCRSPSAPPAPTSAAGDTALAPPVPSKSPTTFSSPNAAAAFTAPAVTCEGAFEEEGRAEALDFLLCTIHDDGSEDDDDGVLHNPRIHTSESPYLARQRCRGMIRDHLWDLGPFWFGMTITLYKERRSWSSHSRTR